VVKSQATRSRSQNQKIAREILAEKVEMLEKGEVSRTAIKTAVKKKRKASKSKKSRRKYRALEEERMKTKNIEMGAERDQVQSELKARDEIIGGREGLGENEELENDHEDLGVDFEEHRGRSQR